MRKTTSDYLQQYHAADLSVIGSMGIDQENAKTIDSLDGTEQVTYGYLKDVVLKDTSESCRIFSLDEDISKYEVVSGRLPEKADEIAFADADKDNYQIGDQITFEEKADTSGNMVLKNKTFTITGFVHSTEILSCVNQGQSTAGSGELNSYAVVTEDAFDCDYYMIARITFRDTQGLDPYSDAYTDKIQAHKNQLETLLEDVSAAAYDKAVEVVTETVRTETRKEDMRMIEDTKKWVLSPERKAPQSTREYAAHRLDTVLDKFLKTMQTTAARLQEKLLKPEVRQKGKEQVKEKARDSVLQLLSRLQAERAQNKPSAQPRTQEGHSEI